MSLDHRFVFADNLVLRCKCEKDEYFPVEILDFEDILGRLKTLFLSKNDTRRNLVSQINISYESLNISNSTCEDCLRAQSHLCVMMC